MSLIKNANELYVAKGKKIVHINLKNEKPTEEELLKLVLGPTGNLRAPTLVLGKKMLVGFNEEMYQQVL